MTRKDYVLIVTAIAQAMAEATSREKVDGVKSCAEHISHALQIDNPRFMAKKFNSFIMKKAGMAGRCGGEEDIDSPKNWDRAQLEMDMQDGITINDQNEAFYSGKRIATADNMEDLLYKIKEWTIKQSYFPNIYYVNERGNIDMAQIVFKARPHNHYELKTLFSWV